ARAHAEQERTARGRAPHRVEHLGRVRRADADRGDDDEVDVVRRVEPVVRDHAGADRRAHRLPGDRPAHAEVEPRDAVLAAVEAEHLAHDAELERGQAVGDDGGDGADHAGTVRPWRDLVERCQSCHSSRGEPATRVEAWTCSGVWWCFFSSSARRPRRSRSAATTRRGRGSRRGPTARGPAPTRGTGRAAGPCTAPRGTATRNDWTRTCARPAADRSPSRPTRTRSRPSSCCTGSSRTRPCATASGAGSRYRGRTRRPARWRPSARAGSGRRADATTARTSGRSGPSSTGVRAGQARGPTASTAAPPVRWSRPSSSSASHGAWPRLGIIVASSGRHLVKRAGKQRSRTSIIAGTAVEAPGEAPRRPAIDPSLAAMTSVPNSRTPLPSLSFLITWTRWPAVMVSQSLGCAAGMKPWSAVNLVSGLARSWPTRYWVRSRFFRPAPTIEPRLCRRSDVNSPRYLPFLRYLGLNPAYGPNMRYVLPSTTRVSRCGTDMGGEPTSALP